MRIYTKGGDLAFKTFIFPDGQPHFKLETYEVEFDTVTVETALKTPTDLFMVGLVCSVLRSCGYANIQLDIRYLLGARMDRAIGWDQPFTLDVVARIINSCGFSRVRLLDAHSEVATKLIRNSTNLLPIEVVRQVLVTLGYPTVVCPDKGAYDRVFKITHEIGAWSPFIQCAKKRDSTTGALSGFEVLDYKSNDRPFSNNLLIIDDICDGGGTFVGLAKELRAAGAVTVNLFVTHGIFSKGLKTLDGIDKIYTTDSYCQYGTNRPLGPDHKCVVIPISMERM